MSASIKFVSKRITPRFCRGMAVAAAGGAMLALPAAAPASTLSVNFAGGNEPQSITSGNTAGVVSEPAADWNNVNEPSSGPYSGTVTDNLGNPYSLTTSFGGSWYTDYPDASAANDDGNSQLMFSLINSAPSVTVGGLPSSGTYNVYAYLGDGNPDDTASTTITLDESNTMAATVSDPNDWSNSGGVGTFTGFVQGANYVEFTGVSGTSFTVADANGNTGFTGIQVDGIGGVPEPASLGLLGVAGLGLLIRRRRHAA